MVEKGDIKNGELILMFNEMKLARKEVQPSKYWEWLNDDSMNQFMLYGYENFKQTINLHYFELTEMPNSRNLDGLNANLPLITKMRVWLSIFKKHNVFKLTTSLRYNLTAKLLWEYTKRNYPKICLNLEEPREGNPARLYDKGKLISEDLANSILEYVSISYHNGEEGENKYLSYNSQNGKGLAPVKTIIELGAGYGRTAYVFLKLHPN